MGWQGNEMEIPVGMIFKKMYCHECGNRLKVKKISNVYKKGDDNYTDRLLGNFTIGMSSVKKTHYVYHCPTCGLDITYDEQCNIAKRKRHTARNEK